MRLQLTVQRHGLPPVQVLWSLASAVRPPLLAVGNSITISQFLEQVNAIIPLESEDWGLEDYSVEVHGFECLHFAEVNQVLKEDDEVCIRPLQTQDLRFRKISGRHQIDVDGKHLVDGVAFGRPFLRRADRPAIRIPPRKRRRITYDEEDDFDKEPINDRQVMIRAGFDDADDATAGNESDDEDDFAPDEEEEDDLGAELEDLEKDFDGGADAEEGVSQDDVRPQRSTRSRRSPKGLGLLQLLDENGQPFAGKYYNPLLDLYGQDEASSSQPEIKLRKRGTAQVTQNSSENIKSILRDSSASPQRVSRRDSAGSNRSVRFEDAERATPATIRESEDSDEADDGDFELVEVDESDKENAEPLVEETESSDSFFEGSQSSSSSSSDDQSSDNETSSSGSTSSDSSSDSEPEQQPSKDIAHNSETSETSSSGVTSSSSSDSEPEPPKTSQKRKWAVQNVKSKTLAKELPPVVTTSASITTPPALGRKSTRDRNKRRKESKRLSFIKSKGILPATATKADLHKFEEGTSHTDRQEMLAVGGIHPAFEAKRQKLMKSISAGGVDVSLDYSPQENDAGTIEDHFPVDDPVSRTAGPQDTLMTDQQASEKGSEDVAPEKPPAKDPISIVTTAEVQDSATGSPVKATDGLLTGPLSSATKTAIVPDSVAAPPVQTVESLANDSQSTPGASKTTESPRPESQHRRSKLDVSGAKRMLFGSLGLRTPKTKDDELRTREKLMKDVRPIREPQTNEKTEKAEDVAAAADDESWKDKIDLRAVECCYDGVELSAPPFPFVQRWDPQQQRGYNTGNAKKRKGKKRKRNNDDYYEDRSFRSQDQAARRDNPDNNEEDSYNQRNKDMQLNEGGWPRHEAEQELSTEKANTESTDQERSHDENLEDSIRANEQLLHETEGVSADTLVEVEETNDLTNDLPVLPEDLTICTALTLEIAAKGNIVAFRQLEMSAETNWQPKISGYRTAIVDEILDDGTLAMTLAKRDSLLKEIQYDEQTGERLYSKFEMPGYHDEGSEGNGKIEISFDELISPILVETVDKKGSQDDMVQAQDHVVAPLYSNHTAVTKEAHNTGNGPQSVSVDGPAQEISNEEVAEPSEEARQEISELIRDAGWRSSVANHELNDRQDDLNEPAPVEPQSPKFHGFSSSPPNKPFDAESSPIEIAESAPAQGAEDSPARSSISNLRSAIDYPDLPQLNDDSEVFQQEAQDRSGLPDHGIGSQDLTSQDIASPTLTSPEKSSPKLVNAVDGPDSDESLPELFSQAFEQRMSQGKEIKSELTEEDPFSPPSRRKSKRNSRIISSKRRSDLDWDADYSDGGDGDNSSVRTQRPSHPGFSSQIVDLTISSDTLDPPDDSYNDGNDDSYILPTGSGWVQKSRTSERRNRPKKSIRTR